MKRSCSRVALLLISLLWSAAARAQRPQDARRAIFEEKGCTHCHIVGGTGGHKGPVLDGVGKRLKRSAIEHQILSGGQVMPPFADVLSPGELHDLVEYLHKSKRDLVILTQP